MFLTEDELRTLTGKKRRKDQLAVLRAEGYPHKINAAGKIVVSRAYVEHRLGNADKPAPEPDFSVFHKAA